MRRNQLMHQAQEMVHHLRIIMVMYIYLEEVMEMKDLMISGNLILYRKIGLIFR